MGPPALGGRPNNRFTSVKQYQKSEKKQDKDMKSLKKQNKILFSMSKLSGLRFELEKIKNICAKASKEHKSSSSNWSISDSDYTLSSDS